MLSVMIKFDGDVGTGSSLTLTNSLNEKYKTTNAITINIRPIGTERKMSSSSGTSYI